jgi:SAM-dependent methyltransferase
MSESVVYIGRDLEAMSFAANYHRSIWEAFKPYMGERLVEVGAGSGSFSDLVLERASESVSLVEPSADMYRLLRRRVERSRVASRVETYNASFRQVAEQIRQAQRPDSIIYVNVLEHVADDATELQIVHRTLDAGGRVFIFVPALPRLYGGFDKQVGHFRRYTKPGLEGLCRESGFRILESGYFDLAGVLPWWIKYRLLKSETMEAGLVTFYDKHVFPFTRALESIISPPMGKNILLVAEKQPAR